MTEKRIITNPKFIVERDGDNWVLKFKDGKIYKTVEFLNAQNSGNKNRVITNPNFSIIGINVYFNNVKVGEVGDNYTLESKIGNFINEPNLYAVITSNGNIIIGVDINGKQVVLNDDFNKMKIHYKAATKPTSTWISTNCIINKFANGSGELVLKNGVTTLEGSIDELTFQGNNIFKDSISQENVENNITEVIIPEGITLIDSAFVGCVALTKITLPNTLLEIGKASFFYDVALTSINIPDSVVNIAVGSFYICSSLSVITIPDSVKIIGQNAFYDCSGLTEVTIGNGVTSIGQSAFAGCSDLTSINIPDSVTEISKKTFYKCSSLASVTIPNSVITIGSAAFEKCSSLMSVICESTIPPILDGSEVFKSIDSSPVCNVPSDSVQAYLDDTAWNNAFDGNIQAIE